MWASPLLAGIALNLVFQSLAVVEQMQRSSPQLSLNRIQPLLSLAQHAHGTAFDLQRMNPPICRLMLLTISLSLACLARKRLASTDARAMCDVSTPGL